MSESAVKGLLRCMPYDFVGRRSPDFEAWMTASLAERVCRRCSARVGSEDNFWGDWGAPLPWLCGACGSSNPTDKRFCRNCGATAGRGEPARHDSVATAPAPQSAERR